MTWWLWMIAGAVALVALALGGVLVYWKFFEPPPAPPEYDTCANCGAPIVRTDAMAGYLDERFDAETAHRLYVEREA